MSHLSNQLHEGARKRFDDLGLRLLSRVTMFRDNPARPRPDFSPDVFNGETLTDADFTIVGVHHKWKNTKTGKLTAIAFTDGEGSFIGLIGPNYAELEALARLMAKARPFHLTASVEFLRSQIFEWVKERHRGYVSSGCVDHVLRALESAATDHRMIFPVSQLHVQSPLTLGSVTVSTFPESIFEKIEPKLIDNPSAAKQAEWCRSMRKDFQGLAVAETCVFGEPIRALEIASDRVELAIGLLRFFAPSHVSPWVTSRIARWGYAPPRNSYVFIVDAAGQFLSTSQAMIDQPGTMVVDDAMRDVFLGVGFSEVRDIVGRDSDSRTDLKQALLKGMVTFGRAALTSDFSERIVWYCAGLESILLKGSDQIISNLSERLAVFSYDTVGERLAAREDVKKAYSLRSGFVHHGVEIGESEIVTRFARHGLRVFSRIAKNVASFNSKDELLSHIDHIKLSGPSQ